MEDTGRFTFSGGRAAVVRACKLLPLIAMRSTNCAADTDPAPEAVHDIVASRG